MLPDYLSFEYSHQSFYEAFKRTTDKSWKITVKNVIKDITKQRGVSRWVISCYNKLYRRHEYHKKAIRKAKITITG